MADTYCLILCITFRKRQNYKLGSHQNSSCKGLGVQTGDSLQGSLRELLGGMEIFYILSKVVTPPYTYIKTPLNINPKKVCNVTYTNLTYKSTRKEIQNIKTMSCLPNLL